LYLGRCSSVRCFCTRSDKPVNNVGQWKGKRNGQFVLDDVGEDEGRVEKGRSLVFVAELRKTVRRVCLDLEG